MSEPLLKLTPKINIIYMMFKEKKMFFSILKLIAFSIISILAIKFIKSSDIDVDNILKYIRTGFIILNTLFILIFVIKYFLKIMGYKKTTYSFFEDRVSLKDTFLNISESEIMYEHIREIEFKANIFDRIFNMGFIYIHTAAEGEQAIANNLVYIKNPEKTYETIKTIIHTGKIEEQKQNEEKEIKEDNSKAKEINNVNVAEDVPKK